MISLPLPPGDTPILVPRTVRSIVVTGAGGFVGRRTSSVLVDAGYSVRALVRRPFALPGQASPRFTLSIVNDLGAACDLEALLEGADALVHLAARVHRRGEDLLRAPALYDRDVRMTEKLTKAARHAGVSRLVFLSSVKALGDVSPNGALARDSLPRPVDAYGRAKLAAERLLTDASAATGLQVVIVRPPLVYGAEAMANFRQLVRCVQLGVPLPLAGIQNRRSIVSVENLASFIVRCLGPMDARCNVFHVSDPEPVSTPQLLRYIAAALGVPPRLFSIQPRTLERMCRVLGREDLARRLLMSLELEVVESFAALGWRPVVTTREGIQQALRGA